ncbi:NAD(+) diphosphatase [Spizellomyces punctatus DAOM BR117]|uniref:NAD(+) diphosphatase n=1 Tax=Spizellomyces punctatus (strain DAOM BR117) TaxID=645134 RepID=A0A0L0HET5_SPIPD|nr:NAD(+) diphosphatase [Spizellomyces punctatus DAOM BR117]KNC99975.1 hypothetical protein SPPG_05350 [Spizellomyces punctatus DAOM BR117]|eukprot:XP_016608015.1 hypothetical protein SPPG_05350 [Spizellomyces punctatus DAOM BR117]
MTQPFTHLFAGNNLNRFSILRSNKTFLAASLTSPYTRFIALRALDPLLKPSESPKRVEIAWLTSATVQGAIDNGAFVALLGVDEEEEVEEFQIEKTNGQSMAVKGRAYWAVDMTPTSQDKGVIERINKELEESHGAQYSPLRQKLSELPWSRDTAILAQARAIVDWNTRNQFCPGCGRKTVSEEAGYKRVCPRASKDQQKATASSVDPEPKGEAQAVDEQQQPACLSLSGVHNFQYPRTDPVVIVAIVHPTDPNKILLGRQSRFPPGWYTCIAGFMEGGETLEEACRREVWEEAGVKVGPVFYHSSQPWPFPNSIMLGCIGMATTEEIDLGDQELEDAKWFTREQVLGAISPYESSSKDTPKRDDIQLRIPPPYAIAHQLIKAWAERWKGYNLADAKM